MGWDTKERIESDSDAMVVFGSGCVNGHTVDLGCCRSAQLLCL